MNTLEQTTKMIRSAGELRNTINGNTISRRSRGLLLDEADLYELRESARAFEAERAVLPKAEVRYTGRCV